LVECLDHFVESILLIIALLQKSFYKTIAF
jgi:hypothetical protein